MSFYLRFLPPFSLARICSDRQPAPPSLCGLARPEHFSGRAGFRPGRKKLFRSEKILSLFGWLVADGWCWFVLREKYCWLVVGGWFVLREKYCWLVADKPSEQVAYP
jgi:hypothetical protein